VESEKGKNELEGKDGEGRKYVGNVLKGELLIIIYLGAHTKRLLDKTSPYKTST
jgi:hypothetical protein